MDADDLDFADSDEVDAIKAQMGEALLQMEAINYQILCVGKKLKSLNDVNRHLKISYESRFGEIEWGVQYAGRWTRSEADFNSRLVGMAKDKTGRLNGALGEYVQGPLDHILEDVGREGLRSEIRMLVDLRKQVLRGDPILNFLSLIGDGLGQPLSTEAIQRVLWVSHDLKEREAQIKKKLLAMLIFLVLFLMEYRRLVTRLEVEEAEIPGMKLISKFLSLIAEARRRCREMPHLRRLMRNILGCYSSMAFLEREVSEFLETLVERMEHLDFVVRDIPQWMPSDCIFLQLEWGGEMMTRCEETVEFVDEQMWLLYGPCYDEWRSVVWT